MVNNLVTWWLIAGAPQIVEQAVNPSYSIANGDISSHEDRIKITF